MEFTNLELVATILFAMAIVHTFSVKRFESLAHRYPEGSVGENLFHVLGEVEVVFGLWAGFFLLAMVFMVGGHETIQYVEGALPDRKIKFDEPIFVFVIMTMAATRPIINLCSDMIAVVARLLPLNNEAAFYVVALILGPLLGSFITEPAAMTVTALILKSRYYDRGMSKKFMYATIGVLFVNISIGGTLTNFAAPPVLMVAGPDDWNWDMMHMVTHFGWKACVAVVINTVIVGVMFAKELKGFAGKPEVQAEGDEKPAPPIWLTVLHLLFTAGVVATSHHPVVFMGFFLFFLGVVAVTDEYQGELKLKEGLLVGFFLGGLVILGTYQSWWLRPVIQSLGETPLFLGSTGLTAITDNAALTYLGRMADIEAVEMRYALVAGAVCGGGLTVIANAPNPAGFGILKSSFGEEGISPLGLLLAALGPTIVAMLCFGLLPHLA